MGSFKQAALVTQLKKKKKKGSVLTLMKRKRITKEKEDEPLFLD
jgi:hypothetical protein